MTPDEARQTLDQLIASNDTDSYASISLMLGRNPAYIQQYIKRGQPKWLSERDRLRIARHFGVPDHILGGPMAVEKAVRDTDIVRLPIYAASASAGPGALNDSDTIIGMIPFNRNQLRELTDAPLEQLGIIRVRGDSMYPTLSDGDSILVDMTVRQPGRDAIYVLRNDDCVQVKRLLVHPASGRLTIKSDNGLYETWHDCDRDRIEILGRVIWVGRRL